MIQQQTGNMVIILDDLTRGCHLHNVISEGTFGGK